MKFGVKTLLKVFIGIVLFVVALVICYLIYFFITYYRIEDNQVITIHNPVTKVAQANTKYTIITYNIGFGAYSSDYGFFMDGGTESRAFSKEAVLMNTNGSIGLVLEQNPDFAFLQEVDMNSTRSYHVNQYEMVQDAFSDMTSAIAVNFDSPYLFYPILEPHGKSYSGIVTLSNFKMNQVIRRSLPIDSGLSKFVDLDRCYSVSEIEVENGKKLFLYNVHLSAYSNEPTTVERQVALLVADMKEKYKAGNYIIVGGDFNQDVLGNSSEIYHTEAFDYSWAKKFDTSVLPEYFNFAKPEITEQLVPTCRLADGEYVKGESFVIAIDGFIISDNITVEEVNHVDSGFLYSDHNPVTMRFILND